MASKKKLKRRNKKLQYKVWEAERQEKLAVRDAKFWKELVLELEVEIEELKAPKANLWLNGEPIETVIIKDANREQLDEIVDSMCFIVRYGISIEDLTF